MQLFNLTLAAVNEAGEEAIGLAMNISIAAICLLAIIIIFLSFNRSKFNSRSMVYAAVSIAASFALSFIKIPFPFGGSITLASFVPIIIYSYVFGPAKGIITGIIYGLLQFLQDSWFLTPVQFILDYILAFSSIGLAGAFKRLGGKKSVVLGVVAVGTARLVMHILAGIIFFEAGYISEGLPANNAAFYSTVYNIIYVFPDILIAAAVLVFLLYSGVFARLERIMRRA